MKYLAVIFAFLPVLVQAQLVETIAMQGVMQQTAGNQTMKDVNKAMQMIKQNEQNQQEALNAVYNAGVQNDVISQINLLKSEIVEKFTPLYKNINKSKLKGSYLKGHSWNIGSLQNGKYYIKINNLNKNECSKIKSSFFTKESTVNNSKTGACIQKNNVKLVF